MALELTDRNPFATEAFSLSSTDRAGFTFDSSYPSTDFNSWKAEFEAGIEDLKTLDFSPSTSFAASLNSVAPRSGITSGIDSYANFMMGFKTKGNEALKAGVALKSVAAAGQLFNDIMTYSTVRRNAEKAAANARQNVENQMLALDNQVMYYKNQIADKFNQAMARNTVTMAAKNLRVTAGSLLEKTKDAAYDATKDIQMLESNAELKKIALRSEAQQAEVAKKLTKTLATTNLLQGVADLGLAIGMGSLSGAYGDLFSSGGGSLNDAVYGG